ncbi:MAG: tRNA preQ1(34) S-adenosylmethionine ribosyltransferase-isomerase QueA [Gammaproteobacteria bacterium]|nr:tRNA preQ1(34) S-adenosylmethionine ribosyltransferase-isomerase QueA [Gammaproteobacteria bacterium]
MNLSEFDYQLSKSQIAQHPKPERIDSRLLLAKARSSQFYDMKFYELSSLLCPGDLLVLNNTRVLPARLFATKPTGGKVEIMLERILNSSEALVQLRANRPIRPHQKLLVDENVLIVKRNQQPFFAVQTIHGQSITTLFEQSGSMPLPHYVDRSTEEQDNERYQTVYARYPGAVAAPTAGLHFDQRLLDEITNMGVGLTSITLHIGAGTFKPIHCENILNHQMHKEWLEVSEETCKMITDTRQSGSKVIAVGTTVVRALESAALSGELKAYTGDTELFIKPGFQFRVVDSLITNFHLPRSTLLVLVSAFAGRDFVLSAYHHAINQGYRFYSYGDAMFLERQP